MEKMKKPRISVIICTYNGGELLKKCINSVLNQNYNNFEILCVDGGSSDGSIDYIKDLAKINKRIRYIHNKNRLPEGKGNGKWLGYKLAKGEVFAIIDQDNILQRKDLFEKVQAILKNNSSAMLVSAGLKNNKKSNHVARYVSLYGTDSFLAYRSLDFLRRIQKNSDIEKFKIKKDNMTLVGSNCLFYLASSLKKVGGYERDIVTHSKLLLKNKKEIYVINDSTEHYSDKSLYNLAIKKFKWGKNYFNFSKYNDRYNYFPKTKLELKEFFKAVTFGILIFPNFYYAARVYLNSRDFLAFIFPYMTFLNVLAYAFAFLIKKIKP